MPSSFIDLLINVNTHIIKVSSGLGIKFNISDYTSDELKKIVSPIDEETKRQKADPDVEILMALDYSNAIERMNNELKKTPLDYYKQDELIASARAAAQSQRGFNYQSGRKIG